MCNINIQRERYDKNIGKKDDLRTEINELKNLVLSLCFHFDHPSIVGIYLYHGFNMFTSDVN